MVSMKGVRVDTAALVLCGKVVCFAIGEMGGSFAVVDGVDVVGSEVVFVGGDIGVGVEEAIISVLLFCSRF